jgi:hypothetical protein
MMDDPQLPPSDELLSSTAFFIRAPDKTRFEHVLRSLLDDRRAATLVSDCDALLDHYGRMLADSLRKSRELAVEVYFPNSTEAVLVRFNRILADLTVAEAIKAEGSSAPQRLLLVYDGKGTGLKELQLLARLLKDFPGANTRLVLLLQSAGADADKKIDAFGKLALRWDVERPSAEEARLLLEDARANGMGPEVQALLDATGVKGFEAALALRTGLRALAMADEALGEEPKKFNRPLAQAATGFGAAMVQAAAAAAEAPSVPVGRPAAKKIPGVLVLGMVALAASAAITALQHVPWDDLSPTPGPTVAELMANPPSEEKPADPMPADSPADPPADPPADSVSASPASADPVPQAAAGEPVNVPRRRTDSTAQVLGPVPEQLSEPELKRERLGSKPIDSEASAASASVRNPMATPPALATPLATPPPPPVSAAKDTKGTADPKGLAPGFYVQHASRATRAEVQRFQAQNTVLAKAKIIRLKRQGATGDNWVLLSGPFSSIDQARGFLARKGVPSDSWVRPASALRPLLP